MRKLSFYCGALLTFLFFVVAPQLTFAQGPAMDSTMVKDGKIYVVVAVLVVIFIGILLFMISMDRRLQKIEKKEKSQ